MKLIKIALRSFNVGLPRQLYRVRTFSTDTTSGSAINDRNNNSFESTNDFELRIFSGFSDNSPNTDSFYQKLDRLEKARGSSSFGSKSNGINGRDNNSQFLDGLDESFNTLSDGMDGNLKKAATYFEFDPDEVNSEDYSFRPDMNLGTGSTYEVKDLDLTKPGIRKPYKKLEFEVTTEEVLRKADFRNVRFLANFITDAGIIIKRSKTRISAKAQRKIAREIKTARAFGLMPFTTMGQDPFVFGKTREDLDEEDDYENYEDADTLANEDPTTEA